MLDLRRVMPGGSLLVHVGPLEWSTGTQGVAMLTSTVRDRVFK